MDFHEIWRIGRRWITEELIEVWKVRITINSTVTEVCSAPVPSTFAVKCKQHLALRKYFDVACTNLYILEVWSLTMMHYTLLMIVFNKTVTTIQFTDSLQFVYSTDMTELY